MADRWVVSESDAGTRLDKFLAQADRLASRSRATAALDRGKVFVNGLAIHEPYVKGTTSDFAKLTVPDGMYFVMGDNRQQSQDSRFGLGVAALPDRPEIGFIPRDDIVGKAWVVVWPTSSWSGI